MYDYTKLTHKDLSDLKVFKKSVIWVLITSIVILIALSIFVDAKGLETGFIGVMLFVLGFIYRHFFNVYIHNYKLFRKIFDKARGKK